MPLRSPAYWRARAEEVRTAADDMNTAAAQQTMRSIADEYEALALWLERFEETQGTPERRLGTARR